MPAFASGRKKMPKKCEVYTRPKANKPKGAMKAKDYPPKYKVYNRPRQRKKGVK